MEPCQPSSEGRCSQTELNSPQDKVGLPKTRTRVAGLPHTQLHSHLSPSCLGVSRDPGQHELSFGAAKALSGSSVTPRGEVHVQALVLGRSSSRDMSE
jgi:hypothetical protein